MRKNAAKKILAVLFALVLILGTGMQALASPESPENDKEANDAVIGYINQNGRLIGGGAKLHDDGAHGIPADWNTLPAGTYYLKSKYENFRAACEVFGRKYNEDCLGAGLDPLTSTVTLVAFADVKSAYDAFINDSHTSTGSASGGSSSGSGSGSSSGGTSSQASSKGSKSSSGGASAGITPETNMGIFQNTSVNKINAVLKELNAAVASGDTAKAEALRSRGVTIETSVWHSFNKKVYQQIENSNIPVTLKFLYKGVKYSVTIPAGAKVTELCDKSGWCGFLNLAAHYGATVLK